MAAGRFAMFHVIAVVIFVVPDIQRIAADAHRLRQLAPQPLIFVCQAFQPVDHAAPVSVARAMFVGHSAHAFVSADQRGHVRRVSDFRPRT